MVLWLIYNYKVLMSEATQKQCLALAGNPDLFQ